MLRYLLPSLLLAALLCSTLSLSAQEDRVRQRNRRENTEPADKEQNTDTPAETTPAETAQPEQPGNLRVRGTLVDYDTGEPIVGANVRVQGELRGAVTDDNGYFEFMLEPRDSVALQISYIGFQEMNQKVPSDLFPVLVKLKPKELTTAEVVVSASRRPEK